MTNFEQPIDRLGTNSVKWDAILKSYNEENLLPLWIADMDFKAPAGVLQAYQKLLEHGILGYADTPETLYTAISNWEQEHFNLAIRKEEILFSLVS